MILVTQNFHYANGQPARNQDIDVFLRDSATRPQLFSDDDGLIPITNPVRADVVGNVWFYIEIGEYDFGAFGVRVPFDVEGTDSEGNLLDHIEDLTPHPAYDDIPSLVLLFENGIV